MTKRKRNRRGDGGYRQRGKDRWELKFSALDARTGRSRMCYVTFRGSETAARAKLRELVKLADDGANPAPARQTFDPVLDRWLATLAVSPKTRERYCELVALHIRPHLGKLLLRTLAASRLTEFYGDLRDGRDPSGNTTARPLAARTVSHIHRLVVMALALAEADKLIPSNPAKLAKREKPRKPKIEVMDEAQVREVLQKLRGRPFYRFAALALATGMRRGEMCALRWKDIDLDGARLHVEQSLEQTKPEAKGGAPVLRVKEPKSESGRRAISLPASIVSVLRAMRTDFLRQQEERLRLGLGREPEETLVFRRLDRVTGAYAPLVPNSVTTEWRSLVKRLGLPKVSLHSLRHTHASQLIDAGMDVRTISRRLGHSKPSITLDVYAHKFNPQDERAASVFDAAFANVFTGTDANEAGAEAPEISGRSVANPIPLHKGARSST